MARPRPEPLRAVGLTGSPRAGGNTDTLLAACLAGAEAAGARAETIAVRDLEVAGCLECLRCREGRCPQPDGAPATLERLTAADLVIVATPVFFCGVPAQLKALIDRAQPLWLRRLAPDHPLRQWRSGFFIGVAASTKAAVFEGTRQTVRSFLATVRTTWAGQLCAGGLEGAGEAASRRGLLRQARSEGARLVRGLRARRRALRREWLEAEAEQIEHAGEIPEVALYAALQALSEGPDSPGIKLSAAERRRLARAALERYRRIVLRDLSFANRRFAIFRGTGRAIINYERLRSFSRRYRFAPGGFRAEAARQLEAYLAAEISSGWRCRSLDCERAELERFAARLGANLRPLHPALAELFERPALHWEQTQRLAFMAATKLYPYRFCRRRRGLVEIGVASREQEAPQRIRLPLAPDREAALAKARAICESIPKPDLPARGQQPATLT